jgi:hypothetical protein
MVQDKLLPLVTAASLNVKESGETPVQLLLQSSIRVFRNKLRILLKHSRQRVEALETTITIQDCEYQHVANTIAMALLTPCKQIK